MTNRKDKRFRFGTPKPGGSAKGFSLIEIVFALTFLAVGVFAIAALIPMGTRGVTRSQVLTSGLMASEMKLEELKGTAFDALATGTFHDVTSVYTRTWTVTDSVPMTGCKKIDVTTTWADNRGTQTAALSSYITK